MLGKRGESRVFFPWEKRRGVRSLFRGGRARQTLVLVGAVAGFLVLRQREIHAAEVRSTRTEIALATRAVAAWRADHERACPASLADLSSGGYLHRLPRDAWGGALRITCPGRRDPAGFDVSSDGPDGLPGGLDGVH
jgi:general secretion pathway protein G